MKTNKNNSRYQNYSSLLSFAKKAILREIVESHLSTAATVFSHKPNAYSQLILFKQQINTKPNSPYFTPYSNRKPSAIFYQAVFLTIGLFYLLLGLILYFKPLTWSCSFLFGSCSLPKIFLCTICGVVAISSILLGCLMQTEKEVLRKIFQKAKRQLKKTYRQKLLRYHVKRYFLFGEEHRKTLAFKHFYQEFLEKLYQSYEETSLLLYHIRRSSSLEYHMKEELYNQALSECRDKMTLTINTFKSANPPQYFLNLVDPFLRPLKPSEHSGRRPVSPLHNENRDHSLVQDNH